MTEQTHYEGCERERGHHTCALVKLDALAACEADTARLDWLSDPAKGNVTIGLNAPPFIPECSLYIGETGEPFDASSLREAIDRARAPRP